MGRVHDAKGDFDAVMGAGRGVPARLQPDEEPTSPAAPPEAPQGSTSPAHLTAGVLSRREERVIGALFALMLLTPAVIAVLAVIDPSLIVK